MPNNSRKIKIFTLLVIFLTITSAFSVNSNEGVKNLPDTNYDLLIIAPYKFKVILRSLEIHKEKHNIKTKIVDIKTIFNDDSLKGADKQEKIKYFIKNEFDNHNIKYVLFVGDYKLIPVRYIQNVDLYSGWGELEFISDLYYADIYDSNGNFSSWNSNNNKLFGEWKGNMAEDNNIDLRPDVYVGRLACSNIFEVFVVVRKIIKYETETYGTPWFKRMVGVGGDSYIDFEGYEGEENTQNAMNNLPDFEHVKLWASNGNLTGQKDVINEINKGCGFIYFDGHGTPQMWATFPPGNNSRFIQGLGVYRMNGLKNKDRLPICLVSACHNLQIDVNPLKILYEDFYHFTWIKKCWGWKLVSKIGGGSIATIGNTGFGLSKEDKQSMEGADSFLCPQFFWEYGINGTDILGEVWGKAINSYLDEFPIDWNVPHWNDSSLDAKTVQQWILLGDPSLKIGGYQ